MSFVLMAVTSRRAAVAFTTAPPNRLAVARAFSSQSPTRTVPLSFRSQGAVRLRSTAVDLEELNDKIKGKGDEIRQLKDGGISKEDLAPHISELLALKSQLPESEQPKKEPPKKKKQPQKQKQPKNKKQPEAEMSESELRQARLDKVAAMKEAGVEPYEYSFNPTTTATALAAEYKDKLEPGEENEEADVALAGRIMTRRVFGKLAFFSVQDETGVFQVQLDKGRLGDDFKVRVFIKVLSNTRLLMLPRSAAHRLLSLSLSTHSTYSRILKLGQMAEILSGFRALSVVPTRVN